MNRYRYAKGSRAENERKRWYEENAAAIIVRSAGSFGLCDLVYMPFPGRPPVLVEVKSTNGDVWRASRSGKDRLQFLQLKQLHDLGWAVRYDIRFNGGRWASFDELPPDGIFRGPKE